MFYIVHFLIKKIRLFGYLQNFTLLINRGLLYRIIKLATKLCVSAFVS